MASKLFDLVYEGWSDGHQIIRCSLAKDNLVATRFPNEEEWKKWSNGHQIIPWN